MTKSVEHVHWPDAPDMWMPYAPAIKVRGGTTIYLATDPRCMVEINAIAVID